MSAKKQSGFSLLEAVVALALVVSVGVTIFGWVNQTLNSVSRIRALQEKVQARRNVMELLWALNPSARPQGRVELNGLVMEWSTNILHPEENQVGYPSGMGDFSVGLYKVKAVVFKPGQIEPWFEEDHQVIGYKKIRTTSSNPFMAAQ